MAGPASEARSASPTAGMPTAGRPDWIVPTTATPFAARSRTALATMAARTAMR